VSGEWSSSPLSILLQNGERVRVMGRGLFRRRCMWLLLTPAFAGAGPGPLPASEERGIGALLVLGEEGGLVDAGPEGFAFDAEGFDGVEVGAELAPCVGQLASKTISKLLPSSEREITV
jgi:hypothetical protein